MAETRSEDAVMTTSGVESRTSEMFGISAHTPRATEGKNDIKWPCVSI